MLVSLRLSGAISGKPGATVYTYIVVNGGAGLREKWRIVLSK